ncbi:MAG: bifunctional adenosylcobinamide kinase/adenosylcobinamide-phosphate guanylyltransferase, partial [Desulfobulbaceae bacterium]|nr:bifunctional adenosylcobinamide kinase/adenosylcobinamide-phosphate guanylyltransferase [Desulfobulbaceae bacterium]
DVFLVDCLTLWLTNLLLQNFSDEDILDKVRDLADAVSECHVSVALVANEVGLGIVPESALARRFRDLAGWCNQTMGARCDQVVFMAAGLPLYMK